MNRSTLQVSGIIILIFWFANVTAQLSPKNNTNVPVLKFEDMLKTKKALNLSDLAESIEYVKLELKKEAVICGNPSIVITSKYIFTRCNVVLQFSRDGKFIRKVGALGKGPREYIYAYHMSVNEKTEEIYINSANKISVYSFNGAFVKEIPITYGYWKIEAINTGHYVGWKYIADGNEDHIFALLDSKAKVLSSIKNNLQWAPRKMSYSMSWSSYNEFYSLNNKTYFKDMYTDTVYTISDHLKIIPAYFLDLGKYKVPDNRRPSFIQDRKQVSSLTKGYMWANVQESGKYIFLNSQAYSENKKFHILYDKTNKSAVLVSAETDEFSGFNNDWDGGIDYWPRHIYNDRWMYTIIPANEFIKNTTDKFKIAQPAKFPEKKTALKTFLGKLNEEDNPMVMIVKLK